MNVPAATKAITSEVANYPKDTSGVRGQEPCLRRPGAVLICVLVCLGIAAIISLGTLKTSLTHRRELQRHWQMEQTWWALEAGWQRALKSRRLDDQYAGEIWKLDGVLGDDLDATILIKIDTDDASPDFAELSVTAILRTKDPVPIVTRRSCSWQLKQLLSDKDSLETEGSQ